MELGCGHDVFSDLVGSGVSSSLAAPTPAGKCRVIQIDALASVDLGLPIERLVITIMCCTT
jgi:hypothetical protein